MQLKQPAGKITLFLLLLALLLLLAIHTRLHAYAYDDAYIHFRIAKHLSELGQPYFNPGEVIKTSSSSAWTILLASFTELTSWVGVRIDLPLWISIWNALVTWLGGILFARLIFHAGRKQFSIFQAIFYFLIYVAILLPASIGLMEVPTAMLLALGGFWLLVNHNPVTLLLFAIGPFFRLELAIVLGLVMIYVFIARPFSLKKGIIYGLAGLLPLAIYDLYYFGTLIPNTVYAKSKVYELSSLETIRDISCTILSCDQFPAWNFFNSGWLISVLVILSVLVTVLTLSLVFIMQVKSGLQSRKTRRFDPSIRMEHIFLFWGAGLIGLYSFGETLVFPWYVPLYLIPIVLSIILSFDLRGQWLYRRTLKFLFSLVILGLANSVMLISLGAFVDLTYLPGFELGARVRQYIHVGGSLYRLFPEATLMTSEIGGLGYGFEGYILDGAGLATPSALAYHPLPVPEKRSTALTGAIPTEFIRENSPDIIVSYDVFIEDFLRNDSLETYERVNCPVFLSDDRQRENEPKLWNSAYLNVLIKQESGSGPILPAQSLINNLYNMVCE
jgi:hypothetical protein